MSDILSVLEQQTSQTENLIARLQQRLAQTQQLQMLEQQRQELAGTIGRLEERLSGIDAELADLRHLAATGESDLAAVTAKFQTTWGGVFRRSSIGRPVVPPTVTSLPTADNPAKMTDSTLSLFGGETVIDTDDLFSQLDPHHSAPDAPAEEAAETWSFDSGLFSAAEELQDNESPDDWVWWAGDDTAESSTPAAAASSPVNDDFLATEMYGDDAVMFEASAIPAFEPGLASKRKGILGRFF